METTGNIAGIACRVSTSCIHRQDLENNPETGEDLEDESSDGLIQTEYVYVKGRVYMGGLD